MFWILKTTHADLSRTSKTIVQPFRWTSFVQQQLHNHLTKHQNKMQYVHTLLRYDQVSPFYFCHNGRNIRNLLHGISLRVQKNEFSNPLVKYNQLTDKLDAKLKAKHLSLTFMNCNYQITDLETTLSLTSPNPFQ